MPKSFDNKKLYYVFAVTGAGIKDVNGCYFYNNDPSTPMLKGSHSFFKAAHWERFPDTFYLYNFERKCIIQARPRALAYLQDPNIGS